MKICMHGLEVKVYPRYAAQAPAARDPRDLPPAPIPLR